MDGWHRAFKLQLPTHAKNIGRFGIFGMEKLEGNVQAASNQNGRPGRAPCLVGLV